jgi:hypothetical protein
LPRLDMHPVAHRAAALAVLAAASTCPHRRIADGRGRCAVRIGGTCRGADTFTRNVISGTEVGEPITGLAVRGRIGTPPGLRPLETHTTRAQIAVAVLDARHVLVGLASGQGTDQ